jgi:hypothetical protein
LIAPDPENLREFIAAANESSNSVVYKVRIPVISDAKDLEKGFSYFVSEEQLAAFGKLTTLQRLQWADEARRFTRLARTPETARRQERLRRGETIV